MRVFVTGATGFIGSAIVRELLEAGHQVTGLARSDVSAAALIAAGADVHAGSLEDTDSLLEGATRADGVIHTAFNHDFINFTDFINACETDRRVITALGDALVGTTRPLIVTSGTAVLPSGRLVTEKDMPASESHGHPRAASEQATDALIAKGVKGMVVRLPPTVHGRGDHGFIPALIAIARGKGVSAFVGEGKNRWPAVHRLDAARLFRLALEKGEAGARYHAVAESSIPIVEIAEVVGRHLDLPVQAKTATEAADHFGWLKAIITLDNPSSSALTRQVLEWNPVHPGLIDDLNHSGYF